jgi:hypothetical protein
MSRHHRDSQWITHNGLAGFLITMAAALGVLAGYVPALAAMILYGAAIVVGYLLVSFAGFTLRQYDRADRATRRHK